MNLIFLALLYGLIATSFVPKSEARLHDESIVGGTTAVVGQNTYAVSIQFHGQHLCGGGILNNRYIITVAHFCIDQRTNRFRNVQYTVVAGVHQAHNKEEPYRVEREIAKFYVPREYNPIMVPNVQRTMTADIAVLELTSDLGLNQFITHVVLPPNASPHLTFAYQRAVVCGYGHNRVAIRHDPHTNRIVEVCSQSYCYQRKFAEVDIISNNLCRHYFRDIVDSHLCGHMRQRSPAEPEGLCTGDSGAPLVMDNIILGVASISPEGCRENLVPAVYTRITSFIPFIIDAMNGVRAANMRLAKYEIGRHHTKMLVEE